MAKEKTTDEVAKDAADASNEATPGAQDEAADTSAAQVREPQFDDGGDGGAYNP